MRGRAAALDLAMRPSASPRDRDFARRNAPCWTRSATELLGPFEALELLPDVPGSWSRFNPSLARDGESVLALVRSSNYVIDEGAATSSPTPATSSGPGTTGSGSTAPSRTSLRTSSRTRRTFRPSTPGSGGSRTSASSPSGVSSTPSRRGALHPPLVRPLPGLSLRRCDREAGRGGTGRPGAPSRPPPRGNAGRSRSRRVPDRHARGRRCVRHRPNASPPLPPRRRRLRPARRDRAVPPRRARWSSRRGSSRIPAGTSSSSLTA